ncbi:unnamed protein product [Jaminaea pallidilutea]
MAHNQAFHRRTTVTNGGAPSSPPMAYSQSPPNGWNGQAGSFSAMMAAQQSSPSANAHAVHSSSPNAPGAIPIPGRGRKGSMGVASSQMPKLLTPFNTSNIRILLLEAVSQLAVDMLQKQGYQVDYVKDAWSEEQLVEKIGDYHVIGIRSKTKLTDRVFKAADKLLVVGCFCIGTNQVDLQAAARRGVCVFNSPFANSRSVAELVIGETIALSRQLVDRSSELRAGDWQKVSKGCYEIRGKTLGIVGYGHIGSQLSVLAEAMGMTVIYFDVLPLMPLGMARQTETLEELLNQADFVTLHVPELPETKNMISTAQFKAMKKGAYLLNNARGTVVDLPALAEALESGHLAGAAVDVYPKEPKGNGKGNFSDELNPWASRLRACPNIILTPHIGGSTEEAQRMIGQEVATSLTRYINFGGSVGAVNFPEVDLRAITEADSQVIRICHVHANQPGALRSINSLLGNYNVDKQHTDSKTDVAYLMVDISGVGDKETAELYEQVSRLPTNILTRLLC